MLPFRQPMRDSTHGSPFEEQAAVIVTAIDIVDCLSPRCCNTSRPQIFSIWPFELGGIPRVVARRKKKSCQPWRAFV